MQALAIGNYFIFRATKNCAFEKALFKDMVEEFLERRIDLM